MIIQKIGMQISLGISFNSIFDIFYLSGEMITMHLLHYSGIRGERPPTQPNPHQSQLVNNPG